MEHAITKEDLKAELEQGGAPAVEVLYNRYGGMLFSYILQFIPDRAEAGVLLADIFCGLATQLDRAFGSSLSLYCWLQSESRQLVLAYLRDKGDRFMATNGSTGGQEQMCYVCLLGEAPAEHQWIFREVFIRGRDKEEVAIRSGMDLSHVSRIMRECWSLFRKNLG